MALVDLDPGALRDRLARGDGVLIDVREANEFAAGHIQGAINVPLSGLSPQALPDAAPEAMVFSCGVGKRSAMAVAKLQHAGVPVSQHLAGGLAAWKAAGLPVVT
jgi:rhodanese-related sulfurtransferase